jgi:beta-1,2-mannobiose phosphorylase / 1,2-beta-oligomannan phosphorylase
MTRGFERAEQNPILTPIADSAWASEKVYNCAVAFRNGAYHMLFRAMGRDAVSRLGYAVSEDGIHFRARPEPLLEPSIAVDAKGCEDPRMTVLDDTFYVAYTAFDGQNARVMLAVSGDGVQWTKRGPLFPKWSAGAWPPWPVDVKNWSKGGAIFPAKVGGVYWMLFGDDDIWLAQSENGLDWTASAEVVLGPRTGHFDCGYVEVGPPPIQTPEGWLVLYHGVDRRADAPGQPRVYRLGVALLDGSNPYRVLARCADAVLEPVEEYETRGLVDAGYVDRLIAEHGEDFTRFREWDSDTRDYGANAFPTVIFCCGAVERDGQIHAYYGAMDTSICLATASTADLLRQLA